MVARPDPSPRVEPQRRGRAARRHGVQRHRAVRLGDRDPGARPPRRPGSAVHELPHHAAVLAVTGRDPDGAQPAPGRLRRGGQLRPGLPGLDHGDRPRGADAAGGHAGRRLRDVRGGQVASDEGFVDARRRAARLVADPAGVRPVLRGARGVDQPPPSASTDPRQLARRRRRLPRGLLLHRRHHRRSDLLPQGVAGPRRRPAVLPLSRPWRRTRSAPRQGIRPRSPPRQLRHRLGRGTRAAVRPPDRARSVPRGHTVVAPQPRAGSRGAAVGRPHRRGAGPLRPLHGGLRGDGRQRRSEPGPAARHDRAARRCRQHRRDLHLRQRGDRAATSSGSAGQGR